MAQAGILKMFARSPLRPLQAHMEKVLKCANLLVPYLDAVIQADWSKAEKLRQEISDAEVEADNLKMDLRLHLPRNLFMSVSRGDILELLSKQDKIANVSKDISGIMLGRKMQIPTPLVETFKAYLQRSLDAAEQANRAISELDELQESGFRGKEVKFVSRIIKELNQIESDTDQIQISLREQLFEIENDLPPIEVMFLYKIVDWVGLLADCAQQVGSRLQMLAAD